MAWSTQTRKRAALFMGYLCIAVFFALTIYVIYVFYSKIAPSVLERKEYTKFVCHFIFGNWLAINIFFNYLMAWLSSPGLAKDYQNLATQYPKCKKCLMNKPPRTHHCGWCDLCVLKFDHHCPCKIYSKNYTIPLFVHIVFFSLGLNNCVGFYNHRYFFQFSTFMAIGCFYAGIFGYREYQISLLGKQL